MKYIFILLLFIFWLCYWIHLFWIVRRSKHSTPLKKMPKFSIECHFWRLLLRFPVSRLLRGHANTIYWLAWAIYWIIQKFLKFLIRSVIEMNVMTLAPPYCFLPLKLCFFFRFSPYFCGSMSDLLLNFSSTIVPFLRFHIYNEGFCFRCDYIIIDRLLIFFSSYRCSWSWCHGRFVVEYLGYLPVWSEKYHHNSVYFHITANHFESLITSPDSLSNF